MVGEGLLSVALSAWLVCILWIARERRHGRNLVSRLPEWMLEPLDDGVGLGLDGRDAEWKSVKFVDGHLVDRVSGVHATLCNCNRNSGESADDATIWEESPWSPVVTMS